MAARQMPDEKRGRRTPYITAQGQEAGVEPRRELGKHHARSRRQRDGAQAPPRLAARLDRAAAVERPPDRELVAVDVASFERQELGRLQVAPRADDDR